MAKGILSDDRFGEKEIPIDFREEFNKGDKADSAGSKILKVLSSPVDFIAKLGRLQFDASEDANNRLKEKISTSYDNRLDLVTKSLPVIKGTKSIDEFKKELKELYDSDFIKDDRQYRALINNYFYHFKNKHLPNFKKEIAKTGKMPKDVVKYFDDYEAFKNSNKYKNPYATKYTRPDLTLPSSRDKKQDGGLLNPKKADLDNDGKLSSYEEARGKAIEENMREEMFLGGILRLGISGAKSLIKNIRKKTNKKEDKNKVDEMELEIEQLEKNYNDTFLPEDSYPLGGAPTDATLKITRKKILKDMDKITSNIEKLSSRVSKQVGGMMMDDQMANMMEEEDKMPMDNQMADMMPEEKTEEQKAIEEAQAPDEQMEENYVDFLIDEALSDDEEAMLMQELQANPQLSMLFDKVMEVAMEFSGSGPVEGPGSEVSDSIPARLSDGEFVFTAKAVDVLGADNLMQLMKQAEAQAEGRQMAQEGGLMEEEDTVMPVQQEPVRQDIRVTKETVDSQAAMQDEEDLVGDEIKKSMLSGRPHVRS